jgi:hypothetical protein
VEASGQLWYEALFDFNRPVSPVGVINHQIHFYPGTGVIKAGHGTFWKL